MFSEANRFYTSAADFCHRWTFFQRNLQEALQVAEFTRSILKFLNFSGTECEQP